MLDEQGGKCWERVEMLLSMGFRTTWCNWFGHGSDQCGNAWCGKKSGRSGKMLWIMCTSLEQVGLLWIDFVLSYLWYIRSKNVEKSAAYSKTFKSNDDGKVNSSGPRQIVSQNGVGPGSGYIQR